MPEVIEKLYVFDSKSMGVKTRPEAWREHVSSGLIGASQLDPERAMVLLGHFIQGYERGYRRWAGKLDSFVLPEVFLTVDPPSKANKRDAHYIPSDNRIDLPVQPLIFWSQ